MSKKIEKLDLYYSITAQDVAEKVNLLIDAHNSEVVEEEWPKVGVPYYFICEYGVSKSRWDGGEIDVSRNNIFGVYRSHEEAEATLAKIKKFLGK